MVYLDVIQGISERNQQPRAIYDKVNRMLSERISPGSSMHVKSAIRLRNIEEVVQATRQAVEVIKQLRTYDASGKLIPAGSLGDGIDKYA
jgi:hypothetical protein